MTRSLLVAFAVPIGVFIAALLGFELTTRDLIGSGGLRMLASLAVALMLAALTVLAIKVITRQPVDKNG